jgi:hypothetical protein
MRGAITPLHNTPSWRGAQLKHRDNFTTHTFEERNPKNRGKMWPFPIPCHCGMARPVYADGGD